MRLTDHTDYSLRVLIYLNQRRTLVTLNALSEDLEISKNNLIKVSNQLAKLNLIETSRGRAGGLVIKKETGTKTLREIIEQTEETFFVPGCFSPTQCQCTFFPRCSLKRSLNEALDAFLNTLAKKTLNDVTPKLKKKPD